MTDSHSLHRKITDATRDAWVDAARDVLIAGGISALNLRGLARSLGVTTGAFYSVFSGIEDLHEALRLRWRAETVEPLVRAMHEAGEDGFAQYRAAARIGVLEGVEDARFDRAMRDWAHASPRTAEIVQEVETLRIGLLRRMFLALGFDPERAEIRARVTHFHQVGYGALGIHDDRDERLMNLRLYCEVLTGRSDLMACRTPQEVRDFIVTGIPPAHPDTQPEPGDAG